MIAVDSSALVAILLEEPSAPQLRARLAQESGSVLSAANYVETGQVLFVGDDFTHTDIVSALA